MPRSWLAEPELGLSDETASCVADTYLTETGSEITISFNIGHLLDNNFQSL